MESNLECQIRNLKHISEGEIKVIPRSLLGRLRLMGHRHLSFQSKVWIKRRLDTLLGWVVQSPGESQRPSRDSIADVGLKGLRAGDLVRVRSREEIQDTLNHRNVLKGCSFMKEMEPYCGTTQRVFKTVSRFLDERDYRVKKTRGIVLLEGVFCEGTELFGPCDRSCFFFWREEWLERID